MNTNDALAAVAILIVGIAGLVVLSRYFERDEFGILQFSFGAHLFSAFAQVWITEHVYGEGDMTVYCRQGVELAHALHYDFQNIAPDLVALFFQRETHLPFELVGLGAATGSTSAVSAVLMYVLSDSLIGACLLVATIAFFGKTLLYRALRDSFPPHLRRWLAVATLLVPSTVFWSSGLLKESLVIGPLGVLVFALQRLSRFSVRTLIGSLMVAAPAAIFIAMIKPYILFPFAVAAGVWVVWTRAANNSRFSIRPVYLLLGAALAIGGVIALGRLFPEYALDRFGEQVATQQELGSRIEGGSNYSIGDPTQRTLVGQLAFAPWALVTALFRPFLFESTNPLVIVSALETTAAIVLLVRALTTRRWSEIRKQVTSSPMMMFALTFSLTFALAVGLSTTNMGTLSRYRMPLIPFFLCLLVVLAVGRQQTSFARDPSMGSRRT